MVMPRPVELECGHTRTVYTAYSKVNKKMPIMCVQCKEDKIPIRVIEED